MDGVNYNNYGKTHKLTRDAMAADTNVSNEVVMEAMRLKDEVKIASPDEITEADVQANLGLVDSSLSEHEKLQAVRIAFAFAFPGLTVPGA